jgi:hypothetical protein
MAFDADDSGSDFGGSIPARDEVRDPALQEVLQPSGANYFPSVVGSGLTQREPEHRGQAAVIRAVMLRDRSGGHSTGRGGGVGSHLNSPVCVVISDVHRFGPATYLL